MTVGQVSSRRKLDQMTDQRVSDQSFDDLG